MANEFFQIRDEVELPGRWFLGIPRDRSGNVIDPESFRVGRSVNVSIPLSISVRREGQPLDWSLADFAMPVASVSAIRILKSISSSELEIHPASVEKYAGDFAVINALTCLACVDESRSEFIKWRASDNRPDKLGQYRQITRLRIDPSIAAGSHIFCVTGWRIALIVSKEIKDAMGRERLSGPLFFPVT